MLRVLCAVITFERKQVSPFCEHISDIFFIVKALVFAGLHLPDCSISIFSTSYSVYFIMLWHLCLLMLMDAWRM